MGDREIIRSGRLQKKRHRTENIGEESNEIRRRKSNKKKTHEIKEFITICLLLVLFPFLLKKEIEVTGVVTDMNKEPLVGVNVTVKDQAGLGAIQILTDVIK